MSVTENTSSNKNNKPARRLFVVIAVLIAANIVGWFFYGQIDLTKDKRYTITNTTKNMLQHVDGKMEVQVYLTGKDLPFAFKSLANSTESMLQHFRSISNNKITYRIVDPLGDDSTTMSTMRQFHMTGIPTVVDDGKKGKRQTTVFPWALVTTIDKEGKAIAYPVFLLATNSIKPNRSNLLKSDILLEYNLANGIHQLTRKERPAVAYLTGNGEQLDPHVGALVVTMQQYYTFDTLNIDQNNIIPAKYKSILIQRPMMPFTDQQKFKLDQYVMNGGHIYWSLNMVTGNLDSLHNRQFNAMPIDLNLNDLLFNYGVRINTNLIEDAESSAFIPLQANARNAEPTMFPWAYFPVLNAAGDHPIVKNMNGVLGRFVSSIDTVGGGSPVDKTILLSSSRYSKIEATPTPVILASATVEPNRADYTNSNLPAAVLLEGSFKSAYSSHRSVELTDWITSQKIPLKDKSAENGKMIVVSDADILTNDFSEKSGPLGLGTFLWDPQSIYDNQAFLLNCMEYMNDDENLLEARNKNFDNHVLDPKVVENERTKWQFINIVLPVIAILIFGAIFSFARKKKYA
jgi:gliding-associated putative ABC transporter substrate-binding component GldG